MKIKIDKFEFTLEEAREVYNQLQELFDREEFIPYFTFPDYPIIPIPTCTITNNSDPITWMDIT